MKKSQSESRTPKRRSATRKEVSIRRQKRQDRERGGITEIGNGDEIIAIGIDLNQSSGRRGRVRKYATHEAVAAAMGLTAEEIQALVEGSCESEE